MVVAPRRIQFAKGLLESGFGRIEKRTRPPGLHDFDPNRLSDDRLSLIGRGGPETKENPKQSALDSGFLGHS